MSQFTNEVLGPVTDAELRATPVPVSGTVTANAGTGPFPVSDNGGSLTVDGTVTANAGTGPFPVSDNGGSLTVDGPLTNTELRASAVPVSFGGTGLATVTSVSVSTTVATVSTSNSAKTKVIIFNESGTLFIKLGSGATSASYSFRLTANTSVEIDGYTGIITAIKASGTSNALVTEVGI